MSTNAPTFEERVAALKLSLGHDTTKPLKYKRLPKMTRAKVLHSRTMNGRIGEVEGIFMPKSAHRRVGSKSSKVTGVSSGGHIAGAYWEDR